MGLGLAAGSTPRPLYAELARRCEAGALDLSRVDFFALDEYVGLAPEHPRSFHRELERVLLSRVNADPARVHLLAGDAPDPEAEAAAYEARIARRGGIGLQILGVGRNGHLGFNEPGSSFASRTRVVELAPETRAANRLEELGDEAPTHAITLGIANLLEARALLVLATGPAKAPAVSAMLEGPVGPACPASAVRGHGDATVLLDREAAAGLGGRG